MKVGTTALLAVGILAIGMSACSDSAMPVSPEAGKNTFNQPESELLKALSPQVVLAAQPDEGYYIGVTASAAGEPDSPRMTALRSIESIRFSIRNGSNVEIDSRTFHHLPTQGIVNPDGSASLTGAIGFDWAPDGSVAPNSRVVVVIDATDGSLSRSISFSGAD